MLLFLCKSDIVGRSTLRPLFTITTWHWEYWEWGAVWGAQRCAPTGLWVIRNNIIADRFGWTDTIIARRGRIL